jgi:acyl-CoA synthetase (AMP-forming)/AMP-acid ligase II
MKSPSIVPLSPNRSCTCPNHTRYTSPSPSIAASRIRPKLTNPALSYLPAAAAAAAGLAYLNGRYALSSDLPLISSLVKAQILGAVEERASTLNHFYTLEAHARSSNRHRPFVIYNEETWSYAEAYDTVLRYGTWLSSKGVKSGDVVALDFVNSDVFVWCWFGLWSVGATPAFLNTALRGEGLAHCIRASTARLVLVDEFAADKFEEGVFAQHGFSVLAKNDRPLEGKHTRFEYESDKTPVPRAVRNQTNASSSDGSSPGPRKLEVVFFDKRLENHILTLPPTRQPDSVRGHPQKQDMAILIFTSGTTGLPKPAIMSWNKAHIGARFIASWMGIKPTDIMHTSMPLYHGTASILGVCPMLFAGGAISLSQKFSHQTFWLEVRNSRATILQYVGETCRYLLAAPPSPLDKQHHVRAAFGNGLRPDVWQPFKDRFGIETINEFYSATEAPAGLFNHSSNGFAAGAIGHNGTLGTLLMRAVGGLTIIRMSPTAPLEPLRDPTTGLCYTASLDEPGELVFKLDPANIKRKFQGYFNNAKATNTKILRDVRKKGDAYFRSGDLVRLDAEGRWYFVDRLGDTFRWKAENVATAQVAEVMGKHSAIQEANVYGVEVPGHDGRAGCAAVVLAPIHSSSDDHAKTFKSLVQHLQRNLPPFAVPVWLRVTRQMHTTGTNKQQKHLFQRDGFDVEAVESQGDKLFWLVGKGTEATYESFGKRDMDRLMGGQVKL